MSLRCRLGRHEWTTTNPTVGPMRCTRCRKGTPGWERPPISLRAREYAYWTVCAAAAVVLVFALGLRMTWWQGTALWCCVVAGRMAARHNERRKAAAQVHHQHAAALRSAAQGMEDAALLHGGHGINDTITYGQAATILRDVAALRDKDQP